ncbi:hypothetical protein JW826_05520 [Candidatus Woesearchaeota archaeon]|nr:hypothetical protein [Candidatus Woesearchaeota archaeon]
MEGDNEQKYVLEMVKFELGGRRYRLMHDDKQFFVKRRRFLNMTKDVLGLPIPGLYNTAAPGSADDERGVRRLQVVGINSGRDAITIDFLASHTCVETSRRDSLDGRWGSSPDYCVKYRVEGVVVDGKPVFETRPGV